ncbi:MAG: NAD(P)-dependent oxidoreductase [Propionicimonas sp.]
MTDQPRIGFIGLGVMGGAVARRLSGAFPVRAFDANPEAIARAAEAGAEAAADAASAIGGADFVMTSLPTPEIVEAFWAQHAAALEPGAIAVDLSTIDPSTARRIAELVEAGRAGGFVSCTLGRTPQHAERGEIPAFVGGPAEALTRLAPVLERMADSVHDMGSVEGATMFKLISNHIGMSNLVVLAEGYALACRAGIRPEVFTAALRTTGGWSTQAEMRLPLMVDGDYATRFAVDLAAKDLRLATDAAARWHLPAPLGSAALSVFSTASASGHGGSDAAAVIEALDPRGDARGRPS